VEETSRRFEVPKEERPKRRYDHWHDRWRYEPKGLLEIKINLKGHHCISSKDGQTLIIDRVDELIYRMFESAFKATAKERIKISEDKKQSSF